MSHDFWKFMVHDFLKINVPRFFEIHSPRFFGIQCPMIFCDFGLFNSLAQAGGGGPYYMIFHYQKHTVLNYCYTSGSDVCGNYGHRYSDGRQARGGGGGGFDSGYRGKFDGYGRGGRGGGRGGGYGGRY